MRNHLLTVLIVRRLIIQYTAVILRLNKRIEKAIRITVSWCIIDV